MNDSSAASAPEPSTGTNLTPPALAERVVAATVADTSWRDSILGDLREEFRLVGARHGAGAARRWYWRHAIAIGGRGIAARLRLTSRSRSWVPPDPHAGAGWRAGITRDLRYAVRTLMRRPGTTAVIVITLGLTLATNSTTFAIMDAIVLRPFRFPDVDRLVVVASSDPQQGVFDRESVTAGDYRDWRRETQTIEHLSACEWWDANLSGIEQPEQVAGYRVTADFFDALRATPVVGRDFVPEEETPGNDRRVILGYNLWQRLFAGDPAIVGRTVRVDGEAKEVVGIAPPGFAIPEGAQMWSPLAFTPQQATDRHNRWLVVVGRLRDGRTLDEARAEMAAIAERQRREFPETNGKIPNAVVTFTRGMADPGAGPFMATMAAGSLLLLLIACANIANLLLARGSERTQEFAMRLALGASRARLAWQLLIEAGTLSVLSVALALPLASFGLVLSRSAIPSSIVRFIPGWQYLAITPAVFWSTAALGAVATVVFALLPALHTSRADVADTLRQGSRTTTAPRQRHWLRNSLAAAQVAVTLALLFGSWLMLSGTDRAVNGAFGFDKNNLLVARVVLPDRPYAEVQRRRQFIDAVLDRVRAIPAVSNASMVSSLPYSGGNTSRDFYPEGVVDPREVRAVHYRRVSPQYIETMKIPLLAGRTLTDADRESTQQVALVSRKLVERYWPNGDAVGRTFRLAADGPPITVVGIVGDVLHDWFQETRFATVYRPAAQDAPQTAIFVMRTVGEPTSVAGDVRRAVAAIDPDQPIMELVPMEKVVEDHTAGVTFIAHALGIMAVIALVLAVMGLYSLMAFTISRRTQELGVRMALGATRWQVIGLTTRQGMKITTAGLLVGALAAVGLGRLMESMLFGLVHASVWQLAGMTLLVAAIAMIASYVPARRTASLDPTVALRTE